MRPETWKQEERAACPAVDGAIGRACEEARPHGTVGVLLIRSVVRCDRVITG